MTQFELILLAVGLSLDAFSVAICKGLGMAKINWLTALEIALAFGIFQGGMPLIGWALGSQFLWLIEPVDHWIAFILLAFIGGKMLFDSIRGGGDDESGMQKLSHRRLLAMAVATSIDALAVGVSFAFQEDVKLLPSCLLIGCTTFIISFLGAMLGGRIPGIGGKHAGILGGLVLIGIGVKLLIEGVFLK